MSLIQIVAVVVVAFLVATGLAIAAFVRKIAGLSNCNIGAIWGDGRGQERWDREELIRTTRCVANVDDKPCAGFVSPLRGTSYDYRCPVCGVEFTGEREFNSLLT
jgi:hypothetical protein